MLKKMQRGFIFAAMTAFGLVMLTLIIGINVINAFRMRHSQETALEGIYEYEQMVQTDPQKRRPPINEMSWAGGKPDAEMTMRFFIVRCDTEGNLSVFGNKYISSVDEQTAETYTKEILAKGREKGVYLDYRYMVVSNTEQTAAKSETGTEENGASAAPSETGTGENGASAAPSGTGTEENGASAVSSETGTVENGSSAAQAQGSSPENESNAPQDSDSTSGELTVVFLNIAEAVHYQNMLLVISVLTGIISLAVVFILVLFLSKKAVNPYARNIERQKQFITDAGHELKTPITSISTSADIAAMLYENDEWIENIRKQCLRLSRLVSDLVTLSRLDEEQPFPEKASFSLTEAAWETAEPFGQRARAQGMDFHMEITDDLQLYGDRSAIQRMMSILLDNAMKYTPEGGRVDFRVLKKTGRAVIRVQNTCLLSQEEISERLFDRFYRPDASRSTASGGSGLGLSIAQAAAQTHGGRLTVSSPAPQLILFEADLPA